jgi:hypothetical protein
MVILSEAKDLLVIQIKELEILRRHRLLRMTALGAFFNKLLILLCYKCDKLLGWPNDLLRQAHKRDALRPI